MVTLVEFDKQGQWGETLVCESRVRRALNARSIEIGRWPLQDGVDDTLDSALAAYRLHLDTLGQFLPVKSVDRVRVQPDHAGWPALRQKFIVEHTHADREIRFFIGGSGIFYLRTEDGYHGLLCEAGDWVSLPAGCQHFFDAGEQPDFDALRIFTQPDGWVAKPTGGAQPPVPLFDEFVEHLLSLQGFE